MNKSELVEQVAANADLTKAKATEVVEAMLAAIQGSLAAGNPVSLIGFGTFSVTERAARTGRNPQTGKAIKIPAAHLPRFRPGKGLRDAVAVLDKKIAKKKKK